MRSFVRDAVDDQTGMNGIASSEGNDLTGVFRSTAP
jgi:hypothetical protein